MEIKSAVKNLFNQLNYVLDQLDDKEYSTPSVSLSGATIGQHIRHSIEFLSCLIDGCDSGVVNYDKRKREDALQENTDLAILRLKEFEDKLAKFEVTKSLTLELSYSHNSNVPIRVDSNFNRELVYNIEHAVHHMALIKIGMREIAPEVALPEGFGVASSTIRHKQEGQEASK